uniref:ORF36 n=1 Tax=Malaco herpesvirus 2 TaxID=3031798 RepID=A0AA48P8W3_9VIRU|nr:TPA_asm: ORF36 [Malaco herpesvirus 2]
MAQSMLNNCNPYNKMDGDRLETDMIVDEEDYDEVAKELTLSEDEGELLDYEEDSTEQDDDDKDHFEKMLNDEEFQELLGDLIFCDKKHGDDKDKNEKSSPYIEKTSEESFNTNSSNGLYDKEEGELEESYEEGELEESYEEGELEESYEEGELEESYEEGEVKESYDIWKDQPKKVIDAVDYLTEHLGKEITDYLPFDFVNYDITNQLSRNMDYPVNVWRLVKGKEPLKMPELVYSIRERADVYYDRASYLHPRERVNYISHLEKVYHINGYDLVFFGNRRRTRVHVENPQDSNFLIFQNFLFWQGFISTHERNSYFDDIKAWREDIPCQ